ncbi:MULTISPECIES: hypothetical protein [Psychrilyobacter]|uniref:Uncharacterized protein n=1 Tax=Psychrilyobacter piezotolerans TaxID=2293438 RepID=A0ABX9KH98_9FUSO|nr:MULTISPECIES: hypothetical protein [Psychrilyobacter]MCS5422414.1 hypothetical protein [Psychrilyobacter sp. S5]NDI78123.1 hypothetical protein [Psychrilyobacter piezotolerans]RDE61707.1 hypothetical protein DV867_08710 [Psychrilyobacter sp. S5]REI41099.1 hypothetical protein DYH56_08710 [Psychrilyobacter piezotolerans]
MNKKIIFTFMLFTLICSTSYGSLNKISFTDGLNTLNLEYTINIGPSEAIIEFYIPTILDYYHWNRYNKFRFDKDVFNLILKCGLYNTDKNIDIIVRSKFFPLNNKILYSKKYNFEHQKNIP